MAPKGGETDRSNNDNIFRDVEMDKSMNNSVSSPVRLNSSFSSLSPRRSSLHNSNKASSNNNNASQMEAANLLIPKQLPFGNSSNSNFNNNNSSSGTPSKTFGFFASKSIQSKAVSACALYSVCSVSMVLTNKSLASSYNDKAPINLNLLLVVFQAMFAVLCVEGSKRMKWVEYPALTLDTIKLWVPVNLFFCAMLFTGMVSLQHNSVPMVTIFKNITNIMVASGDSFFFNASVEALVIASFAVTLGGAIAAAWNDITSTWTGLFWMAANCCATAGYVLYMKYATKHVKLSKFGMVFVNNLLCVVFLLPAACLRGEVYAFLTTKALHTFDYFGTNSVAGFMGFFLNFAALNCVSATGPTTYAVVGSLNKVPVAFLGYFMFDSAITSETWFFICVSLCGGFLYSYAKIRQTSQKFSQHGSK